MAVLGTGAAELLSQPERRLSAAEERRFSELISRRSRREPVARILGRRGFYGRDYEISPATLDPRADSETLVEAALGLVEEMWGSREAAVRIIDVGTGSGCLLVSLLAELPNAVGLGTDTDPDALEVARRNAARHEVSSRASWKQARSLERIEEAFDVLLTNPPYIRTDDLDGLEPEVRDFDPRAALDGGCDGLRVYREIAQNLARVVPRGWALFEVGMGQAEAVGDILARASSSITETRQFRDLNGIVRCVAWRARH